MDIYPIEILLFETDVTHVQLVTTLFQDNKIKNNLRVIREPTRAMAYIRQNGYIRYKAPPDLMLISYDVQQNQTRIVDAILHNPRLNQIPRILMFDSFQTQQAYHQDAHHEEVSLIKPLSLLSLVSVMHHFKDLGLSIVSESHFAQA